ncbi:glycosyltransferase family 87 protein [Paraburkholderia sp. J11-2]|uniref:glycosyltransferase family 87 protein n=1 Tax=Paraburkholderia sp. J11-2 TaxID=2805431 RepID=UPI002AB67308|nr:glycosyltransferase family 87 protein [Paraburkholderia sp. J11-2]
MNYAKMWVSNKFLVRFALLCFYPIALWQMEYIKWVLESGKQSSEWLLPGGDFRVFWSAAHVALAGAGLTVYDYGTFHWVEEHFFGPMPYGAGYMPWCYLPVFLMIVTPLGFFPFWVACALWDGLTLALMLYAVYRVSDMRLTGLTRSQFAIAAIFSPPIFLTLLTAQNVFLVSGLAMLAVLWVGEFPVLAGLCVGLLVIKPQFAVAFPFVLAATRAWKAFLVAMASAIVLVATSVAVEGWGALMATWKASRQLQDLTIENSWGYWHASPGIMAALRLTGFSAGMAHVAWALCALVAIMGVVHVWKKSRDRCLRAGALAASVLLISPYAWHYELTWLGISSLCLYSMAARSCWLKWEQTLFLLAWLMPIYNYIKIQCPGLPILIPIEPLVCLLFLLIFLRRCRLERELEGISLALDRVHA